MSTKDSQEKKRRLQNACDSCKKRKVKCDSGKMEDRVCTNCISLNIECLHAEPVKRRGPKSRYVEQLERRLGKMETMLKQAQSQAPITGTSHSTPSSPGVRDAGIDHTSALINKFETLKLADPGSRYFGASSGVMLAQAALDTKKDFTGAQNSLSNSFRHEHFWEMLPWELESQFREIPQYFYPPKDLIAKLVDEYFEMINIVFPILHEPSFRKNLAEGLHHEDYTFGATVLLVCSVASRYLQGDPRIFIDGHSELSAGWKWYNQVYLAKKSLFSPPTLFELQSCCLTILYVFGTSSPHSAYIFVALGLRHCQELGLHMKKPDGYKRTKEDEQFIRCFWVLISLDRFTSTFSGRPVALHEEEFNAEYPLECDDIYWDNPDPTEMFVQPRGKPSSLAFFICYLNICKILGMAMKTLYSSTGQDKLTGQAAHDIILQIDSSLNHWLDQIPEHLRWNNKQQNTTFFTQSAILYTNYYLVQIQTHRPFIHISSPLTLSSLAICANAARSCSHVIEAQLDRDVPIFPNTYMAAFISGTVILLNLWGGKTAGTNIVHSRRDLADVDRCLRFLRSTSVRWSMGIRLMNMLFSLVQGCPDAVGYRSEDGTSMIPNATDDRPSCPRARARAQAAAGQFVEEPNYLLPPDLPMYSDQLQQMPIYRVSPPAGPYDPVNAGFDMNSMLSGMAATGGVMANVQLLQELDSMVGAAHNAGTDTEMALETMTNNTINLWSDAPTGFALSEWGRFLESMDITTADDAPLAAFDLERNSTL